MCLYPFYFLGILRRIGIKLKPVQRSLNEMITSEHFNTLRSKTTIEIQERHHHRPLREVTIYINPSAQDLVSRKASEEPPRCGPRSYAAWEYSPLVF